MGHRSLKYTACHEAGHAVVAHINGFVIRQIRLWRSPWLDDWKGEVIYEPREWHCPACGSTLHTGCYAEEFADLQDSCRDCREKRFSFIERCLAGCAATSFLLPAEHNWDDSGCDRKEMFKLCSADKAERSATLYEGLKSATKKISQSIGVVEALRDQLVAKAGIGETAEMSAVEAEAIFSEPHVARSKWSVRRVLLVVLVAIYIIVWVRYRPCVATDTNKP